MVLLIQAPNVQGMVKQESSALTEEAHIDEVNGKDFMNTQQ